MDGASNLSLDQSELYNALDEAKRELRLLRSVQGHSSSLEFELKIFSLNDGPEYKSLSYSWTEAQATEQIFVNSKAFLVRPDLLGFLRLLSKESKYWIFIDAICINQDDMGERSQQVRLMRDIYLDAAEVVVWLGCDDLETRWHLTENIVADLHMAYIQRSHVAERSETWNARSFLNSSNDYLARLEAEEAEIQDVNDNTSGDNDEISVLLAPFVSGDYWKRTWIMQEIILARALSFRRQEISITGETFFGLLKARLDTGFIDMMLSAGSEELLPHLPSHREPPDVQFTNVMTAYRLLHMRSRFHGVKHRDLRPMPLQRALMVSFGQNCLISYDKIFGLLGLTASVLRADYRMPKLELMTRVLVESLLQSGIEWLLESTSFSIVSLHRAILSAAYLDFDHPTVTVTLRMIMACLQPDEETGAKLLEAVIESLFLIRWRDDGRSGLRASPSTRALALHHTARLLRFCNRYKDETVLLPVDETHPESLDSRSDSVVKIFVELGTQMTLLNGAIPKGLPLSSPLRPRLESLLESGLGRLGATLSQMNI